jgi:hypothetical protein
VLVLLLDPAGVEHEHEHDYDYDYEHEPAGRST